MASLDAWLKSEKGPRHLLVIGAIGRGKSSLVVRWMSAVRDRPVIFVPISIRFGISSPEKFYTILATKLAAVCGDPVPPGGAEGLAEHCFDLLSRLDEQGRSVLVVLDGLDELIGWRIERFLLRSRWRNVRFLLSARPRSDATDESPDGGWIEWLEWDEKDAAVLRLHKLSRPGVGEIVENSGVPLRVGDVNVADELFRLSEGDPLLLDFLVRELRQASDRSNFDWASLTGLQAGLGHYLRRWWNAEQPIWRRQGEAFPELIERLLALFACALGPLRHGDLEELLEIAFGASGGFAATKINHLERFVVRTGGGYVLGHPRLAAFIRDHIFENGRLTERSRLAFLQWGKQTLVGLEAGVLEPGAVPTYLLQAYPQHLSISDEPAESFLPLLSIDWVRAWETTEDGYGPFVMSARGALREIRRRATSYDPVACWTLGGELVLASIRGAWDFPVELLVSCVERGVLSLGQAFGRLNSASPEQRARGLALLSGHLGGEDGDRLFDEAISAARHVRGWLSESRVLGTLLRRLPRDREEMRIPLEKRLLAAAARAGSMFSYLQVLAHVAPVITGDRQWQLADWLVGHWTERQSWDLGHYILPYVSEHVRRRVLAFAANLGPEGHLRGAALAELFEHLDDRERRLVWREAHAAALELTDPGARVRSLVAVLPYAGQVERDDCLDALRRMAPAARDWRNGVALFINRVLPGEVEEDVLVDALLGAIHSPVAVENRVELITAALIPSRLAARLRSVETSHDSTKRREVLAALSPFLDEAQLREALGAATKLMDGPDILTAQLKLASALGGDEGLVLLVSALEKTDPQGQWKKARNALYDELQRIPSILWSDFTQSYINACEYGYRDAQAEFRRHGSWLAHTRNAAWDARDRILSGDSYTEAEALEELQRLTGGRTVQQLRWSFIMPALAKLAHSLPPPERARVVEDLVNSFSDDKMLETRAATLRALAPLLDEETVRSVVENTLANMRDFEWRDAYFIADFLPLLDSQRRAKVLKEILAWENSTYAYRVRSVVYLMRTLATEERAVLHPHLLTQLQSFDNDDQPISELALMLALPEPECRIALELVPDLAALATREQLLRAIGDCSGRLLELEGRAGVVALLSAVSGAGRHFD